MDDRRLDELPTTQRLTEAAPELERILTRGSDVAARLDPVELRPQTVWVTMRDGVRLATDVYLPPDCPAPAVAMRTPYGRANPKLLGTFMSLAWGGYVVISQDCRGTGDSEPDRWDYYVYEREDSIDFVDWVTRQPWFAGFLGSCGGSYIGQTQWCMAAHPRMSTIVPQVSGLGVAQNTARLYLFLNAYARAVGKGESKSLTPVQDLELQMMDETLAGGYFNESLRRPFSESLLDSYPHLRGLTPADGRLWLWEHYCALGPAERAKFIRQALGVSAITAADVESLSAVFGHRVPHDAHALPHPRPAELCKLLSAPALMITGWYDWALNDALATWDLLAQHAREPVRARSRLLITPGAHNMPGYHEGREDHPELERSYRTSTISDLLLRWYEAIREDKVNAWPSVIFYLMGANEWRAASGWPPPGAETIALHLGPGGTLAPHASRHSAATDRYTYHPDDPTPTIGGSIVSNVYAPGSVDVSVVQRRPDVLTYTTAPFERSLDVVGSLCLILYASSSAIDTDFNARLSDVWMDGRAIQLQSGLLRARYRNASGEPELLTPGRVYRFGIDMWATAHRFKPGHRLRLDISSADFPRFDRNTNRGGETGPPLAAVQSIHHGPEHPSRLLLSILGRPPWPDEHHHAKRVVGFGARTRP